MKTGLWTEEWIEKKSKRENYSNCGHKENRNGRR
jgi:hypothetical protein